MDKFIQDVSGWSDFYVMIGGTAAVLTGLLFVSLSLSADIITRKTNVDLRILAAQTFTSFISVLMFAVLFLIPAQGPIGLGVPMLGIDMVILYVTFRRFLQIRHGRPRTWGRSKPILRLAVPAICFITVLIIAITVLLGFTGGLYWFVPVVIILIWDASINAWDLLLKLRESNDVS